VDDSFWGANEYTGGFLPKGNTNWATHIRNFTVSGLTGPAQVAPTTGIVSAGVSNAFIPIFERDAPILIASDNQRGNSGDASAAVMANSTQVGSNLITDMTLSDPVRSDHAALDELGAQLGSAGVSELFA
jgi:hypothetical protein